MSQKTRIGIVGGGQLALLFLNTCRDPEIEVIVLDTEEAPAHALADESIFANVQDAEAIKELVEKSDIVTIEIENCNTDALEFAEQEGLCSVFPSPSLLKMIKDKGNQKEFYRKNNIPTSDFKFLEDTPVDQINFPIVQKLRVGGYDGRGVKVLKSEQDYEERLPGASILESKVDIKTELACIVARNSDGAITTTPVVEMVFDESNQLAYLLSPTKVEDRVTKEIRKISEKIAKLTDLTGILAIEFFLTPSGEILVNEMAPRLHNSGHHSIEANETSQFELFLQALLNREFGSTETKGIALMANVVGDPDTESGTPDFSPLVKLKSEVPGFFLHNYLKKEVRPNRKLGHVTLKGDDLEALQNLYEEIKPCLKVKS
jgi:5-(carboxyamino)imidazole ribonucleotide synthase